MSGQLLPKALKVYRIGDPNGTYSIFDSTGSKIAPGRWNTGTSPMIYTSEHYSTSLLEKLVHGSGMLPPNQHWIEALIPPMVSYESFNIHDTANRGWDDPTPSTSKAFGERWYRERRSLLLIVPSVVARIENNVLINQDHPEFYKIEVSLHQPVAWDKRLFSK